MKHIIFVIFIYNVLFSQDKGLQFYRDEKYQDARNYYQGVIDNRKNDLSAQFGLGVTAYKQKKFDEAIRIFNKVKNVDDKELASKALYNLGTIFKEQNQF